MKWTQVCEGVPVGADYSVKHAADTDAPDRLCGPCRTSYLAAEAVVAWRDRKWRLFAHQDPTGFRHFYSSTTAVRMCGDVEISLVELVPDEAGPYWAWYHSHHPHNYPDTRGTVSMVYGNRVCVEVCFPYGTDVAERRGHGRVVRVAVTALRPARHPEGIE